MHSDIEPLSVLIRLYRAEGFGALTARFPELLMQSLQPGSSDNLRNFTIDLALDLENYESALKILSAIEDEGKVLSDVHHNVVAFTKWNLGDLKSAIESYYKSLAIEPQSVSSLRGLCMLLNEQNRDIEALPYAKRWLQLAPNDSDAIEFTSAIFKNAEFDSRNPALNQSE